MANGNVMAKNAKSNFSKRGWLLIIYMICAYFCFGGLTTDGMNTVIPAMAGAYEWNSAILYTLNTVGGWVSVPLSILFGILAEKKSTKYVYVLCFTVVLAGWYIMMNAGSIAMYGLGVILIQGFAVGAIWVVPGNLGTDWFPTKKGLFMGWVTIGVNLATAFWNQIFNVLVNANGLKIGANYYGIVFIIVFAVGIFVVKSTPEEVGEYPDNDRSMTAEKRDLMNKLGKAYEKTSPWTIGKLLKTPIVWKIGVAFGIIMLLTMGTVSQLVPTITSYGYDTQSALNMMTVCAFVGVVGSYFFGWLDAKIGTKKASVFLGGWSILAVLFLAIPGAWTIYPAIFFLGAFIGASNNLIASFTSTVFGRYDFTRAWTIVLPITVVIRSCGYAMISWIATITGTYNIAYAVLTILAIIALVIIVTTSDKCIGRNEVDEKEIQKYINETK